MNDNLKSRSDVVAWALRFEAGVGLMAVFLGLATGYSALDHFSASTPLHSAGDVAWGIVAAIPLFVLLVLSDRFPIGPLRTLQDLLDEKVLQLFRDATASDLAMISLAAGLGEELLFRGVLQPMFVGWTNVVIGIGLASLAFGVCHWISGAYAVAAACVGVYLGILFHATGSLAAPIVTHALYDYLALMYLLRWRTNAASSA